MANREHLQILDQGVEAWNQWRSQNEDVRPDLREADLSARNLQAANFSEANLASTDFSNADLTNANLTEAYLWGATLTRAILTHASLARAELIHATFAGANLSDTDLLGAYFLHTTLVGADVSGAGLSETVFSNTDLTDVRGLETGIHLGPSTLDHRTLAQSGPLPPAFLRGCGLPDALIEYLPSLLGDPIQYDSLFISYASRDQPFAERLYADLQNKGVRCWYAPEDMKIWDEYRSRIDASIHLHDRLLLILSQHSIKSRWVQKEVETAFEKEEKGNRLVLFPIRLDDVVMQIDVGWAADIRRQRHIGDFTQWKKHDEYQQAFNRLLHDLKAENGQPHG